MVNIKLSEQQINIIIQALYLTTVQVRDAKVILDLIEQIRSEMVTKKGVDDGTYSQV